MSLDITATPNKDNGVDAAQGTRTLDVEVTSAVSLFGGVAAALLNGAGSVVLTAKELVETEGRVVRITQSIATNTFNIQLLPEFGFEREES
jgi:hypothetical protein